MSTNSDNIQPAMKSNMMDKKDPAEFNEEQISRLLRFKKYELPPPAYHENFLLEFQRRQRVESMRPNWWERFKGSVEDFVDRVRVPGYAYATVGLFAIATGAWILSSDEIGNAGDFAMAQSSAVISPAAEMRMDISSTPPAALPNPVNIPGQRFVGTLPPRYLLQSRPSGENEPFSF